MEPSHPLPVVDNGDSSPPAPASPTSDDSLAKPGTQINGTASVESEAPRPATLSAPTFADSSGDTMTRGTSTSHAWPAFPDVPPTATLSAPTFADSSGDTMTRGVSTSHAWPAFPDVPPTAGNWSGTDSSPPSPTDGSFSQLHAINGRASGPADHYPSIQSVVHQSGQRASQPTTTMQSSPSPAVSAQPSKGESSNVTNGKRTSQPTTTMPSSPSPAVLAQPSKGKSSTANGKRTPQPTTIMPSSPSSNAPAQPSKGESSHVTNGNAPEPVHRSSSIQSTVMQTTNNIQGTPVTARSKTGRKLSSKCQCHCDDACNCSCLCMHYCICRDPCEKNCALRASREIQNEAKAKKEPRNLIVSIDGTSNQFGKFNTNVVELHSHVVAEFTEGEGNAKRKLKQKKCYLSGIGTALPPDSWFYTRWRVKLGNLIDLAIAWRFEHIVKEAYAWLMNHYKPGDRIFLFGFSRGAYQIRTIAGMIHTLGLLHAGNHSMVSFAYDLYLQNHRRLRQKNGDEELKQTVNNFKKTFSHDVRIHFIGAWDTVSSIGVIKDMPLPFTDKTDHVCFFRHALALDEGRVKFIPEYLSSPVKPIEYGKHGSTSLIADKDSDETTGDSRPNSRIASGISKKSSQVETWRSAKEVWFSGSHSDVGGGYKDNLQLNSASIPLLWMENEATLAGLKLDDKDEKSQSHTEWDWDALEKEKPTLSMNMWWRIFEYLPIVWFVALDEEGVSILDHSKIFLFVFFTIWGVVLVGLPTWLAVTYRLELAVGGHWTNWDIALYSYLAWANLLLLIQLFTVSISLFKWRWPTTLLTILSFGVLPLKDGFTMSPHQCKGRVIRGDQLIHVSVAYKNAGKYSPMARLPAFDWKSLVGKGLVDGQTVNNISWAQGLESVLEMDLFDSSSVQDQLEAFKKATSDDRKAKIFQRMAFMVMSDKGAQTVANDEAFINETLEQIKKTDCIPVYLAGVVAFIARLYRKDTPTLQKHVVSVIPQLVGHIKTYLGSSVPVIDPDTVAAKPTSEVDPSPALEKTAGDIVNHSMALIATFIGNDFLYVWTNNPLETVTQPASISIFTQALKYRETRYQAVKLLTALLGTYDPIISEEIENNDGVKSLIEILNDCDHNLLRKVVRCLAQLNLTSGYKHKDRIFGEVFPRLVEIGTKSEDLPLRVSAIQAFISFRDNTFDDAFVSTFVAKEVQDKLQKLIMGSRESLILRLISSEVLATVIGDKPESIKLQDDFLRHVVQMLHRPMPVISLNQALEEGKILETDLRYYCSKSKDLSQSNLALPILLALTRAPEQIALRVWNLGILSNVPRLLATGDEIVIKWFTACLKRLAQQDSIRQAMLERGNIPHQWRKLTALEHWFNTLLIRIPTSISTHGFFSWLWVMMSSDWWIVRKEIDHHRTEMQKKLLISFKRFISEIFNASPEFINVFFAARVQKWTGSIERIISGLENTDMKMVLKMLRDPQVSCPPDMIDFLAQLLENADLVKYEHAAERVLRTILAIGSKSQEKNMDTRKRAYTTIQELCESETIRNLICSTDTLLTRIVAPLHSELSCHPKLIDVLITLSDYPDVVSHPAFEKLLTGILEICIETNQMGIRLYVFDAVTRKLSRGNEPLKLMLRKHRKQFRTSLLRLLGQYQPLVTIREARAEIGMNTSESLGSNIDPWKTWWSLTHSTLSTLIAPRTLALSFLYQLSCVIEKDPDDNDDEDSARRRFVSVIWGRKLIPILSSIFSADCEAEDIVTKKLAVWLVNYMIETDESVKKQILKTRIPSNALSVSDGLEAAGHSLSFKKSALFAAVSTAELPFELGWGSTLGSYWN